ncbi:hypothetical protein [Kitasatospora sp. NPDC050543]|uniref:hypothetical protein n=1 Tax=Kitasatospora sp. NPDC050543 TaxID=3364054 RepID=UPI0037B2357C
MAVPASATPSTGAAVVKPGCTTVANQPCAWLERDGGSVTGLAHVAAPDPGQLTLARVEIKVQRAWGKPWETVASSTLVRAGSIQLATPKITTDFRVIVCATGGPALDATLQASTCTSPF